MRRPKNRFVRAGIEVGFIVFLFYANLLMGEFTASAAKHKTLQAALLDIVTLKTFAIALTMAVAGFLGFEWLREQS